MFLTCMCKLGFHITHKICNILIFTVFYYVHFLSITLHNNSFFQARYHFFRILWFWFYNRFLNKIYRSLIYKTKRGAEIKKRTCKSRFKLGYSNSLFFRQEGECWEDNNTVTIMRKASSITV